MVKPKRVGHLVINVKDLDTSVKFYQEVLGFELALERPGFGIFLTCGKIHHDLALFQAAPALLEALGTLYDSGVRMPQSELEAEWWDAARSALAQARGEKP